MPAGPGWPLRRLVEPRIAAPILVLAAAALSFALADRGVPSPDEGAVLTAASRILRGAVFYRDLDAYWFPGSAYLVAGWMALAGEHLSSARLLAGAAYCATVLALYLAALRVVGPARAAVLGLFLLAIKILAWPLYTGYFYADLAFAAAAGATALLLGHRFRGPSWQLAGSGLCVGLACVFKQNLGIYLGIAVAAMLAAPGPLLGLPRRGGRALAELAAFGACVALPVLPFVGYFAVHGLAGAMVESALLRPFTGYLPTSGLPFAPLLAWWELGSLRGLAAQSYLPLPYWGLLMRHGAAPAAWWLPGEILSRAVYSSVVIGLAWVLLARLRALLAPAAARRDPPLFAVGLLAAACALSALPRADFFHVIDVYPLILLLLLGLARSPRPPRMPAATAAALCAASAALAFAYFAPMDRPIRLERAALRVAPADVWLESVVRFVRDELAEDEAFFVYGHEAQLYFLTGRFFPWPFAQLYPGQAGGDGGEALVARLERAKPRLVVRGVMRWPGIPRLPDYAAALHRYIGRHYEHDPRAFERYPPPGGAEPPRWAAEVLRRRP